MKEAFDNLNRRKLTQTLRRFNVNKKLVNTIAEIYEDTGLKIRYTDELWITKGVRQGCPLSSKLFSLFIAALVEKL